MFNQSILKILDIQELNKLLKDEYSHEKLKKLNFFDNQCVIIKFIRKRPPKMKLLIYFVIINRKFAILKNKFAINNFLFAN